MLSWKQSRTLNQILITVNDQHSFSWEILGLPRVLRLPVLGWISILLKCCKKLESPQDPHLVKVGFLPYIGENQRPKLPSPLLQSYFLPLWGKLNFCSTENIRDNRSEQDACRYVVAMNTVFKTFILVPRISQDLANMLDASPRKLLPLSALRPYPWLALKGGLVNVQWSRTWPKGSVIYCCTAIKSNAMKTLKTSDASYLLM